MAEKVLLNGEVSDKSISVNSESLFFNYGYGFFETILFENNSLMFYNEHIERLQEAIRSVDKNLDFAHISKELIENYVMSQNLDCPTIRVKIIAFDNGEDQLSTTVQCYAYERNVGDKTVWIDSQVKDLAISNFKSVNYMHNMLRKKMFADKYGVDEILFLNKKERVLEGSYTNIAVVLNGNIYFVEKSENYLDGVMQQQVEKYAEKIGFKKVIYKRRGISPKMLRTCDEVILLNSMQIAVNVSKIYNKKKQNIITLKNRGYAKKIREFFLEEGLCR